MAAGNAQWPTYVGVIERIVEHYPGARSLFIGLPDDRKLRYTPGQFISLALPLAGQSGVRAYTIATSPDAPGPLEMVLNLVPGGAGSAYLFERKVGDRLTFTGPFGLFTLADPPDIETIFAAEQTAIAPIRPMLMRALGAASQVPIRLLHAARSSRELLYRNDFEALAAANSNFRFDPVLTAPEPGWTGLSGALIDHLRRDYLEADSRRDRNFYLCAVGQRAIELRDLLRKNGYPRKAVQYERW